MLAVDFIPRRPEFNWMKRHYATRTSIAPPTVG